MDSLLLYSYFRSSCSYRVRIALYLKNIPFTYKPVHLVKEGGEQFRENFKKVNPLSQVPCLKHKNRYLTQSLPIILYLEDLWPSPPLFPKDSFHRTEVLSLCEIINSSIQPLQNFQVLKTIEKELKGNKIHWARLWIEKGLSAVEEILKPKAGTFSFGDHLTAADLFLVPQMYNAKRFQVPLDLFPTLQHIHSQCLKLEAFKKAQPDNQPDAPSH